MAHGVAVMLSLHMQLVLVHIKSRDQFHLNTLRLFCLNVQALTQGLRCFEKLRIVDTTVFCVFPRKEPEVTRWDPEE